ncbi:MAG: hypothetical protein EAZ10_11615 [Oscillatoriales cyanobacterium]|nr:MAG: hypothetical protein EAZ10_11615 [Oscillatoriales cyanobacterium]
MLVAILLLIKLTVRAWVMVEVEISMFGLKSFFDQSILFQIEMGLLLAFRLLEMLGIKAVQFCCVTAVMD